MSAMNPRLSSENPRGHQEEEYRPWYRDRTNDHPFRLVRKINLRKADGPAFKSLAIFPWNSESLSVLWDGSLDTPEYRLQWQTIVSTYWDAVAVGSEYQLYIFFTQSGRQPLSVKLQPDEQKLLEADKMCVKWGLSQNEPFQPLIMFSRGSLLFIHNPELMGVAAYHRGHGGAITSIAVHPLKPHLFATTSRDYTTRIYNLDLRAELPRFDQAGKRIPVPNPHWPPNNKPSLAGAAHGLHLGHSETEGTGIGRCICVLMGGRSGGHQAAVLGAAFHPSLPIIATCGMDRAVKIWPVRPIHEDIIKREDKPIFSSSRVHKARVLSINWLLNSDMLLTHSAPAIMRIDPDDPNNKETRLDPGELTVWRWLSMDRFFPSEHEGKPITAMRGISADWQESSSFKLISTHAFPPDTTHIRAHVLNLFQAPTHDPLILFVYPRMPEFLMFNASHMRPLPAPPFPEHIYQQLSANPLANPDPNAAEEDAEQDAEQSAMLADATGHLHLSTPAPDDNEIEEEEEDQEELVFRRRPGKERAIESEDDENEENENEGANQNEAGNEDEEDEEEDGANGILPEINRRPEVVLPEVAGIVGWKLSLVDEDAEAGKGLMEVAMGMGGRTIIGVGTGGCVWVWRYDTP